MRYVAIAFLLLIGCASGQDIKVIPSPQKTSKDLGLEFISESVEITKVFGEDSIKIQGTVTNTSDQEVAMVKVVFTVKDKDGGFIVRDDDYTEPTDIGVGEVGYVSHSIKLKKKIPAIVEYSVMGRIH